MPMRLSADEFVDLVREALDVIPAPLAAYMDRITVDVEPMPDPQSCEDAGIDDSRTLPDAFSHHAHYAVLPVHIDAE